MRIEIDEPRDGTHEEFLSCQIARVAADDQEFLKKSEVVRKHFRVLDASTPVPNCRAAEIFMAIWMARWMCTAKLSTDITTSGTIHEYADQWGIEPPSEDQLRPWFEFYTDPTPNPKGFPSFVRNPRLQPFAPIALAPDASLIILRKRLTCFAEAADLLGVPDVMPRLSIVDFGNEANITFRELIRGVPFGKTVGRFPCPACSTDKPTYHAIRRGSHDFVVTRPGSMHLNECLKCKGVVAWRRADLDIKLTELIQRTGFIVNGMAAFVAIDKTLSAEDGVIMRDYSNPRGITKFAHDLWGGRLRVSTRLTIRYENGNDVDWKAFREILQEDPAPFLRLFNFVESLSDGRRVAITI